MFVTQCFMQMLLKCADIGHLAAAPKTHKRWAYQLEEEFFLQVRNWLLICISAFASAQCSIWTQHQSGCRARAYACTARKLSYVTWFVLVGAVHQRWLHQRAALLASVSSACMTDVFLQHIATPIMF